MKGVVKKFTYSAVAFVCVLTLSLGLVAASVDSVAAETTKESIHKGVSGAGGGSAGSGTAQVKDTIQTVVNILLFLIGMFAVIMIVIAGFRFVTANGDANTVSQARNTIIYAVIGIVVAVMAYAIVNFILNQIT